MIDHLTTSGGGESVAIEIALRLDRERFKPSLCVTRPSAGEDATRIRQRLTRAGVEVHALNRRSRFDFRPWIGLPKTLREQGIEIVHSHKFGSNVWAAAFAGGSDLPILVAHEHSWDFRSGSKRALLDRYWVGCRAGAMIAVSEEDRRRMIEIERIPPAKVRVISNGVEDPGVASGRIETRRELGLGDDDAVIGMIASLRPEKAVEVAIEALPRVLKRVDNAHLVIAGGDASGGSYLRRLREMAEQLDVRDRVRFLGHRDDVAAIVQAFDVGLLCSDREGSPLSVMEYMAQERPVVATAVGGVPEIVEDGVTGILVRPRDAFATASALADLLENRDRAAVMGIQGRERFLGRFTIERMCQEVADLYDELLGESAF